MKTATFTPVKPPAVCRTCLAVLKEDSYTSLALEIRKQEKLTYCVPELTLDVIPNAVMCTGCSAALDLAYDFKTKCLEVEAKVRLYIQRFHQGFVQAKHQPPVSNEKQTYECSQNTEVKFKAPPTTEANVIKQPNPIKTPYEALHQVNLIKATQTLVNRGTDVNFLDLSPTQPQQSINKEHYNCYYCNRSFDRLSLLKTHTISHTGMKPFTCTVCGKGCSHRGELNNHVRIHTGEKPYGCSLCEASFSQISNMKIHMRTHTGEKPYKCDYCEKMFSHKCGVKVHMRTHTGERPYKCEVCCKTYTHKKDLDDHMRTHTGEKYRCTICSKEITYKKNLSAHMVTHSGKGGVKQGANKKHSVLHLMYPQRLMY